MFIGKYYHTVEKKGRVSLPKKFREETEEWVITRGLDGSLFLFTEEKFEQEVAQLADRSFTKKTVRDFTRLLTNEASQVSPDQNGRILLPASTGKSGAARRLAPDHVSSFFVVQKYLRHFLL